MIAVFGITAQSSLARETTLTGTAIDLRNDFNPLETKHSPNLVTLLQTFGYGDLE